MTRPFVSKLTRNLPWTQVTADDPIELSGEDGTVAPSQYSALSPASPQSCPSPNSIDPILPPRRWPSSTFDRLPGGMVVASSASGWDYCVTCADEGRPAVVISAPDGPYATVIARSQSGDEEVDATLVAPTQVGDWILIHAGTAIARLDGPPLVANLGQD